MKYNDLLQIISKLKAENLELNHKLEEQTETAKQNKELLNSLLIQ